MLIPTLVGVFVNAIFCSVNHSVVPSCPSFTCTTTCIGKVEFCFKLCKQSLSISRLFQVGINTERSGAESDLEKKDKYQCKSERSDLDSHDRGKSLSVLYGMGPCFSIGIILKFASQFSRDRSSGFVSGALLRKSLPTSRLTGRCRAYEKQ